MIRIPIKLSMMSLGPKSKFLCLRLFIRVVGLVKPAAHIESSFKVAINCDKHMNSTS